MSETPAKIKSKYAVRMERDFDNPKWIEQHKHMFNFLDVDENGKISRDELVFKSNEEICTAIKAAPEQKKRQQKCIEDFFGGAGLKYGVEIEWPEYIEGRKKLATSEWDKWANEEPTLIRKWDDVLFEIIDKDGSGSITLEEWKHYTEYAGIIQNDFDAKRTFDICDMDSSGELDVDEITRQHVGFW